MSGIIASVPSVPTSPDCTNSSHSNRPVVLLAGWLGCERRNLRRYEALYNRLGWNSILRICSPAMVVAATTTGPEDAYAASLRSTSASRDFAGGDDHDDDKNKSPLPSVALYDMAVDSLREVEESQCPCFLVHCFSNGGCFLWEIIRHVLLERECPTDNGDGDDRVMNTLSLRDKLVGLVFDSSPAYFGGTNDRIHDALQYVPSPQREELAAVVRSRSRDALLRRNSDFWNAMSNDRPAVDVPRLYLYGGDDDLAPVGPLEELISRDRRRSVSPEKFGPERSIVRARKFSRSGHCRHFFYHPEEYERELGHFLEGKITSRSLKSRL